MSPCHLSSNQIKYHPGFQAEQLNLAIESNIFKQAVNPFGISGTILRDCKINCYEERAVYFIVSLFFINLAFH